MSGDSTSTFLPSAAASAIRTVSLTSQSRNPVGGLRVLEVVGQHEDQLASGACLEGFHVVPLPRSAAG
jgi:hypothetical protein